MRKRSSTTATVQDEVDFMSRTDGDDSHDNQCILMTPSTDNNGNADSDFLSYLCFMPTTSSADDDDDDNNDSSSRHDADNDASGDTAITTTLTPDDLAD